MMMESDNSGTAESGGCKTFSITSILLIAVAIGFRFWKLGSVPGINGDEAWFGINATTLLHGGSIPWFTPTNNPVNPFYFLPLLAVHKFAAPSVVALRSVALASGVGAIAANFFLCRRAMGLVPAIVSTLLLAVLPIDIAYSRLGWDPSQSVLASIFVVYCSLLVVREPSRASGWLLGAMIAFICAIVVHPTNIFLGPIIGAAAYWQRRPAERTPGPKARWPRAVLLVALVGWGLLALDDGYTIVMQNSAVENELSLPECSGVDPCRHPNPEIGYQPKSLQEKLEMRFFHPLEVLRFARNAERLFSGVTVYRYVAGSCFGAPWRPGQIPLDLSIIDIVSFAVWGAVVAGAVMGVRDDFAVRKQNQVLLWGPLASAAAFYFIAGPVNLQPHLERYALWMVAPGTALFAAGLCGLGNRFASSRSILKIGTIGLCAMLLASFYVDYFRFIERTGGLSHDTFRTADTEPKVAALQYILSKSPSGEPVTIVSYEWWNRLPLKYLASHHRNIEVLSTEEAKSRDSALLSKMFRGELWYVEYADSDEAHRITDDMDAIHQQYSKLVIRDYGGYDLLVVIHPLAPKFRSAV